ncbi:hypothetical protein OSB04_un000777, partial [Centaurea solstitialis]
MFSLFLKISSDDDKAKLYLRSDGKWAEGWNYVEEMVTKGVKLKLNTTFQHLLNYCSWKCEIDRSSGQLNLFYKNEGQIFQLTDDEDVSVFLQFAKGSQEPPVLYVDVYLSGEGDGAGTSNTINEEPMYLDTESQIQQSHETSYRAVFGYGLSDSYPEVVPETQQHQQQEVQEEEDEDEYEYEEDEEDEENEEGVEPSRLRQGLDDYFGIPPLIPTPDFLTEHNEGVPYRRSKRLSKGQVFDTKDKMILEVGMKFIEEQFEYKTKKSCTKRYEIACARDHCKWSMKVKFVGDGGTRKAIRTDSSGHFAECFVALGVSIYIFLENLQPVLIIDAAHLNGEYLGTMFLVVAMDGNNNIVPVALGVGRSKIADEWTWFLNRLKTCIGEPRGLVFMSDRAASINAAITAIFPNAHHALCCRHLVMNVRSRAPRIKQFKTPYWKACKAYTMRVFDRMMNILQVAVPEGAQLMQEVGVDGWSRAHFPAQCFNIRTSNSAESINALSRNAHKLPIVGLMEYFREFQQEWYFIRRRKGVWAQKKIHNRIVKSATWTAHGIGYDKWEVRDYGYNAEVDMRHRSCTCLKWQVSGLPYGHAITVAKRLGRKDVFDLITVPYYMTEFYKATYYGVIKPVGPAETWHYPQNPLPTVLPPLIIKRPVGRPKGNKRRPSRGEIHSQQKCP